MYGFTSSILVTVSRIDIMAAVGEHDDRKANWLEKARLLVGERKAGYRKRRTTIRSKIRIRIGVIEIGLNSAG